MGDRSDRAIRAGDRSDRATRIDLSSALPAVRSLAANRNRVPRSAKSLGRPRVAQHQPWELSVAQCHRVEAVQQAVAEVLRLDIAEPCWAPER